jgi:hypothetical protein
MDNQLPANNRKHWFPAILVGALFVTYALFNFAFIRCPYGCEKVEGGLVSELNQEIANLSNAGIKSNESVNKLRKETETLDSRIKARKLKEEEIANTQEAIGAKVREIADLKIANANVDTNVQQANLNALNTNLEAQKAELVLLQNNANKALEYKNAAQNELVAFRSNISSRYSSRLMWVFLTIIFTVLCSSAGAFSCYVMSRTLQEKWKIWAWASIGISLTVIILSLTVGQPVMSTLPFSESLYAKGDISPWAVDFFNVIAFAAIVFFVAAICSIVYAVEETKNLTAKIKALDQESALIAREKENLVIPADSASETEKNEYLKNLNALEARKKTLEKEKLELEKTEQKLSALGSEPAKIYDTLRNYMRIILYIGSALLFFGIVRIDILSKWHLTFVSSGFTNLLTSFFHDLLRVQAGFYTILLATIYLPAVYMIPATPDSPDVKESIDKKGFFVTLRELAPRLIAVMLPLLAPPITDLIKQFLESK